MSPKQSHLALHPEEKGTDNQSIAEILATRRRALRLIEVAEIMCLSRTYVYDLVRDGKIPHTRIGSTIRFDGKALAEWWRKKEIVTAS